MSKKPQIAIQKQLADDPLLNQMPQMGVEGLIATVHNDKLIDVLREYSGKRVR